MTQKLKSLKQTLKQINTHSNRHRHTLKIISQIAITNFWISAFKILSISSQWINSIKLKKTTH